MVTRLSALARLGTCAIALAAGAAGAFADDSELPGRAARLSYVQGSVAFEPAGTQQWTAAGVNQPLTSGDRLWADQGARAELQVGATAIRLDAATGFSLLNLDDRTLQMQITAGTVGLHVQALAQAETVEIDTPILAVSLPSAGDYRIEVSESGEATIVKVSSGVAEVTGAGQTFQIDPQQRVAFTSTGELTSDVGSLGAPDDFDEWGLERDRRAELAQAQEADYVSPDVTGYQDLQDYGTWRAVSEYGEVWVPTAVSVVWAPYRYGRWVWVFPWGWTWIDASPWGFAPFHYGRWAFVAGSWCWVPGPRHVRPVYAPALVGFVSGPHFNLAAPAGGAVPGVAWFPLAPGEPYAPATRALRGGALRYANQNMPGAVTAVPQSVFVSAQPVAPHAVRLNAGQLATGATGLTAPAIVPERVSVLGAGVLAGQRVRVPPAAVLNRMAVVRTNPPPAPVPFDALRAAVRDNGGRLPPVAELTRLQLSQAPREFTPASMAPPAPPAATVLPVERRTAPEPNTAPAAGGEEFRDERAPRGYRAPVDERPPPDYRSRPVESRDGIPEPSPPPARSDRPPSNSYYAPRPPPPAVHTSPQAQPTTPENRSGGTPHTERAPAAHTADEPQRR